MLRYRRVLPGRPPEARAGLPRLLQPAIQHDRDMEEHPLQLRDCHGASGQLQHGLPHLTSVLLRRRRLEVPCGDGVGDHAEHMQSCQSRQDCALRVCQQPQRVCHERGRLSVQVLQRIQRQSVRRRRMRGFDDPLQRAIMFSYILTNLRRIKQKYFRQHGGLLLFEEMKSQQGAAFKIFSEGELQEATDRFDEQHVIGPGGHGKVYRGVKTQEQRRRGSREKMHDDRRAAEERVRQGDADPVPDQPPEHRQDPRLLPRGPSVHMLVCTSSSQTALCSISSTAAMGHGQQHHVSVGTRLRIAHESAEALALPPLMRVSADHPRRRQVDQHPPGRR